MTDPITRELSEEAHVRLLMFPENDPARLLILKGDRAFRAGRYDIARAYYMQAINIMPLPDPMKITAKDAIATISFLLLSIIIVIFIP